MGEGYPFGCLSPRLGMVSNVVSRYLKFAGPLGDVSKLRHQAVFLIGAGGSGKGFVGYKWLKYMPGGGPGGVSPTEFGNPGDRGDRKLKSLDFTKAVKRLRDFGVQIEVADNPSQAVIPFKLYDKSGLHEVPKSEWETYFDDPKIQEAIRDVLTITFGTPEKEIPSYFRQVNPDIYKEELPGYMGAQPGYVHEMSSVMSKAYIEAALETGDPVLVDGTGANTRKVSEQIALAKHYGYRTSLVFVFVPLTVNQIRNATRPRNVDPMVIVSQWRQIQSTYNALKGMADKARVVDNRNDKVDFSVYRKNEEKINSFIRSRTNYGSLLDLIQDQAPAELGSYGRLLISADR